MTDEEVLARIHHEQGYLVLASNRTKEIGTIQQVSYSSEKDKRHWPVRCIGPSNYAEHVAQLKRMCELDGSPFRPYDKQGFHYYRMEPTD